MNQHPDGQTTDWNFPSTNATTALFYHHRVGWSVLLWPWLVFPYHRCDGNKAKQITNQIPGHPDSGMASCSRVGWVGVVIGGLYLFMVMDHFLFALDWFQFQYSENSAETSSILANRLLLPAGPKSWTEEDLRWMCRIEHCRKDGSEPKTSRNFRIF